MHSAYLRSVLLVMILVMPVAGLGQRSSSAAYDARGRPIPDAFDWSGFALGVGGGTLGLAVEGTFHLASWLNFRLNAHYNEFSYKTTIDKVDYGLDLSAPGTLFLLDIYPGPRNGFRFTAGLGIRDAEVSVVGTARPDFRIGGLSPAADPSLISVGGKAQFDQIVPYVGIGFGNVVLPDRIFSFSFDIGLLIQEYSLDLDVKGAPSSAQAEAIEASIRPDLEKRLDWLTLYPVVTLTFSYHF